VCTGIEKVHWASRLGLKMLPFDRLIYSGVRQIDSFETEIIKKNKIKNFSPPQVIDYIRNNPDLQFHISFNVDALDPNYISSPGTTVKNGLHPEQVRNIIEEALPKD